MFPAPAAPPNQNHQETDPQWMANILPQPPPPPHNFSPDRQLNPSPIGKRNA